LSEQLLAAVKIIPQPIQRRTFQCIHSISALEFGLQINVASR
jgi:hypothetical protein